MKARRRVRKRVAAVILLAAVQLLQSSCGGPYKSRRIRLPGEKLALGEDLFSRERFSEAAIEYKDFLATFAGDERSDFAQFRLAECYRLDEDYAVAAVEYRILIGDYGYSEYVDDAFFLEGMCFFKQALDSERDQTKSYEALNRISRYMQLFPGSPRIAEAKKVLDEIHERLGKKEFNNAKLYLSKKRYSSALIYLDKIINGYPATIWAGRSHYYRGYVSEKLGDVSGAIRSYRQAISFGGDFKEKDLAAQRMNSLEKDGGIER